MNRDPWLVTRILVITCVLLACSFTLSPINISYAAPGETSRLGVWITIFSPEKVLDSKENTDRLIDVCRKCGIDDIYLQVYRGGKLYYEESAVKYLIRKSQDSGIKVHAWLNMLSIAQNEEADILQKLGKQVLTIDQHGRSSMKKDKKDELDKYYIRENQLFLEPGNARVREYLTDIAGMVAEKYPGLSGLHLDYIRYPSAVPFIPGSRFTSHGISYGYGKTNLESFKKETGIDIESADYIRENFKAWDDWRRDQVSSLVRDISERVRAVNPSAEISCAIVSSMERTYLVAFQDWTGWLDKDWVDYVVVMNYTDDARLMKLNTDSMILPGLEEKVHIGIGAYLLKEKRRVLKDQIRSLQKTSPAGIVLFSYDEIAASGDLQNFLAEKFK